MKINWNVRLKSKKFWLAFVPAFLLVAQSIATPFGYSWDITGLGVQLTGIVNAVFALLAVLGIVVDPTTDGLGDSKQALQYVKTTTKEQLKTDNAALKAQVNALQEQLNPEPDSEQTNG